MIGGTNTKGDSSGSIKGNDGRGRENGRSTWREGVDFSVIIDVTETGLVRGERRTVRRWCRSAVDDVGGITVEGVERGIEGIFELIHHSSSIFTVRWSFEARWEVGQLSMVVEICEETKS